MNLIIFHGSGLRQRLRLAQFTPLFKRKKEEEKKHGREVNSELACELHGLNSSANSITRRVLWVNKK